MKVTVVTPLKLDKKKTAQPGQVVEIDDDDAQDLAAVGAVMLPPEEPKAKKTS